MVKVAPELILEGSEGGGLFSRFRPTRWTNAQLFFDGITTLLFSSIVSILVTPVLSTLPGEFTFLQVGFELIILCTGVVGFALILGGFGNYLLSFLGVGSNR